MWAKLGEFVRIIKAKSLIAKDFFRSEAFSEFAVKEFFHGVGCRISITLPLSSILPVEELLTCTFSTLFTTSKLSP